jgi:transcriptional regulator with XRE-family HTH domain
MAVAIPADVNPALLVWAREQSGYDGATVARRLGVALERLEAWERGERKPTVRQTQSLAKYYHRPFGIFFLPQPLDSAARRGVPAVAGDSAGHRITRVQAGASRDVATTMQRNIS